MIRINWNNKYKALMMTISSKQTVGTHIYEAIKDRNQVKHKCEVEYTPFLSLLCPWRLDGLQAGQPGLDSRQGQDVSLLHNVQTGSGANPASYPVSTGGPFSGGYYLCKLEFVLYNAIINFSSSFISYLIPSTAGHFC
jgi:hypothetical protein